MIDGISVNGHGQSFEEIRQTVRNSTVNNDTGEHERFTAATISGIKVSVRETKKTEPKKYRKNYRGSIHSFAHDANYTDFTFSDFLGAVIKLEQKFNVDASDLFLCSFEFGVNIETPIEPSRLLRMFVHHKKEFFSYMSGKNDPVGITAQHDAFTIKIYDKGRQYKLGRNLMRFEVKGKEMRYFKQKGIHVKTLNDLADRSVWVSLSDALVKVYDEIFVVSQITPNLDVPIKKKDEVLILKGSTRDYWRGLKEDGHKGINYLERRYRQLSEQHGGDIIPKKIRTSISEKAKELCKAESKEQNALKAPYSLDNETLAAQENLPNTGLLEIDHGNEKFTEYGRKYGAYSVNIGLVLSFVPNVVIERGNQRICRVCENDISGRDKRSMYCSKRCKNSYTNSVHNPLRKIKKEAKRQDKDVQLTIQIELFDTSQFTVTPSHDFFKLSERRAKVLKRKGLNVSHRQREPNTANCRSVVQRF